MKDVIKHYYELFDERLGNGTIVIFIIAALIGLAGISINEDKLDFKLKNNLLETKK